MKNGKNNFFFFFFNTFREINGFIKEPEDVQALYRKRKDHRKDPVNNPELTPEETTQLSEILQVKSNNMDDAWR